VTATGGTTGETDSRTFTITTGTLTATPASGAYGTTITVTGSGFQQFEDIRIDFGSTPAITTVVANASGGFSTTFTVDVQAAGNKTIFAEGKTSGANAATTELLR
jgi:hypothetical protein